jgi:cytochrome c553
MRSIRFGWLVGVLAVSLARPVAAHAGGDAAAGKQNSLACTACHVASDPAIDAPRLAGQRELYLAKQLEAFKRGDRVNPLMSSVAKQLSDADIANLAAFWSSQPAGSDVAPPGAVAAIKRSHMVFPGDFPNGFVLYLTSNIAEQNTIRKTYINAIGFQAAKANKPLPDGSAVIVVIGTAKLDTGKKPVLDNDGHWVTDKITSYSGMEARAGWGNDIPALLRNANWNYSLFTADKAPRGNDNQAVCLACHKQQAVVSYLFSFNELQDHASAP